MPTDNPRVMITVDDKMLARIEEYRYQNKISTRAKATVELIQAGMDELQKQKTPSAEAEGVKTEVMAALRLMDSEDVEHLVVFAQFLLSRRKGLTK